MKRILAPKTLFFHLSSQYLPRQHRASEEPVCLASPPVQSSASLHTSNALTIPKPPANKAGRVPAGNQTFLWQRQTPSARLASAPQGICQHEDLRRT